MCMYTCVCVCVCVCVRARARRTGTRVCWTLQSKYIAIDFSRSSEYKCTIIVCLKCIVCVKWFEIAVGFIELFYSCYAYLYSSQRADAASWRACCVLYYDVQGWNCEHWTSWKERKIGWTILRSKMTMRMFIMITEIIVKRRGQSHKTANQVTITAN